MKTRIKIPYKDYAKLCDIAIAKGKSVEDTLMDLLEIAGNYDITKVKIKKMNDKTIPLSKLKRIINKCKWKGKVDLSIYYEQLYHNRALDILEEELAKIK